MLFNNDDDDNPHDFVLASKLSKFSIERRRSSASINVWHDYYLLLRMGKSTNIGRQQTDK